MAYGLFLNSVVSFLIIALSVFFVIKGVNAMKRREEEQPRPLRIVPTVFLGVYKGDPLSFLPSELA